MKNPNKIKSLTKQGPETMTVTIPSMEEHQGIYSTTVTISKKCPVCGGKRGEPFSTLSYDGSRRLSVDGWVNECGHVDKYSDVMKEALNLKSCPCPTMQGGQNNPDCCHRPEKCEYVKPESTPVIEQKEEEEITPEEHGKMFNPLKGEVSNHYNPESKQLTPNDGWISVKERLPESNKDVIVTNIEDRWVCSGWINPDDNKWYNAFEYPIDGDVSIEPTHWMPLPKSPKQ